jgi:hypothetical protein
MSSVWGNFRNWLESDQGWVFYALILGFILSFVINLAVFLRRPNESGRMATGSIRVLLWRLLAMVGASITLISVSLPHGPFSGSFGNLRTVNLFAYVFGAFWLTLFGLPRRTYAILGVFWGGLALLVAELAVMTIAEDSARTDISVIILSSLALTVGSALMYIDVGKKDREQGPTLLSPQPSPPTL